MSVMMSIKVVSKGSVDSKAQEAFELSMRERFGPKELFMHEGDANYAYVHGGIDGFYNFPKGNRELVCGIRGEGHSSAAIAFRKDVLVVARQYGFHLRVDYTSRDEEGVQVRKIGRIYK